MSTSTKLIRNSTAEFLIFTGQAGEQSIEARYEQETVWLTQKLLAELFAVDVRTVSEHLKNIYESKELERAAQKCKRLGKVGLILKKYLLYYFTLFFRM